MRSIGIRLGIVGAFVLGGVILRPFLTGNAAELSVGDCFDEPASATTTIEDVQHRPCTDPHDAEVVFVDTYQPASDAYPADAELEAYYGPKCVAAFTSHTGIDFATDTTYDMVPLTPTSESWSSGNHKVICYAVRIDGAKMTAPLKKP